MRPTLLSIGDIHFHGYTVMLSLAFLVCTLSAVRENYRQAQPYPVTPIAGIWIALGGLIGAKAYWILQYGDPRSLYRALYIWEGGLVFYGGLIGGLLAGVIYMRWKRIPLLPMGDLAMPYVVLGYAITRVGCFLNGCCWGRVCDLPWAVTFPRNSLAYRQQLEDGLIARGAEAPLPVHPTQLYSVLGLLLIFFLMRHLYRRPHPQGSIMLLYPLLYGIERFVHESYRGDSAQSVLGMTVSQAVSFALFALAGAAFMLLWATVWRRWRYGPAERGPSTPAPHKNEMPIDAPQI